jgi:AcrR family transcriptional regulator
MTALDPAGAPAAEGTRARLLAAAAALFAERGFRGATMRAIAARAGTNLAAANYHFGSKRGLYHEVAFALFLALERRLDERGLNLGETALAQLPRARVEELLHERVELLVRAILEPPGLHGTLMMRELCDPTDALREITRRFIDPMRRAMAGLVRRLEPALDAEQAERCVRSIAGQIFFHRTHRAALLLMMGRRGYPRGFEREVASHVVEFSLGGMARLAGRHGAAAGAEAPR